MGGQNYIDLSNYQNRLSLKNKAGRALWFIAYWLLFRPFFGRIFSPWRNFVLKCFGAKISGRPKIFASVQIWAPWNLEMDGGCISYNCQVYNVAKIVVRKNSVISHNVHLCSASHDISSATHDLVYKPIVIEDQVWVASDAFIGPGVIVRQGSVVAARAVVVREVPPWSVVAGNPAQVVKERIIAK